MNHHPLATLVLVFLLSACSGESPAPGDAPPTGKTSESSAAADASTAPTAAAASAAPAAPIGDPYLGALARLGAGQSWQFRLELLEPDGDNWTALGGTDGKAYQFDFHVGPEPDPGRDGAWIYAQGQHFRLEQGRATQTAVTLPAIEVLRALLDRLPKDGLTGRAEALGSEFVQNRAVDRYRVHPTPTGGELEFTDLQVYFDPALAEIVRIDATRPDGARYQLILAAYGQAYAVPTPPQLQSFGFGPKPSG